MGSCPKGGDHDSQGQQKRENAGRGKIKIIETCSKCGAEVGSYIVPGEH